MHKGGICRPNTRKMPGCCCPIVDCGNNYYAMLSNNAARSGDPSLDDDTALGNDATLGDDATLSNYALLGGDVCHPLQQHLMHVLLCPLP
jgi:hypothetical protein